MQMPATFLLWAAATIPKVSGTGFDKDHLNQAGLFCASPRKISEWSWSLFGDDFEFRGALKCGEKWKCSVIFVE